VRNEFTPTYTLSRYIKGAMASAVMNMPHAAHVYHPQLYNSAPQAPPLPPVENTLKLPSISNLFALADSPTTQVRLSSQYIFGKNFPPTPPMQAHSGSDGRQLPFFSSISQFPVVTAPIAQRQLWHSDKQRVIPYPMPAYSPWPYIAAPQSVSSYYPSPIQPTPPQQQLPGMCYQRPLPQVCHLH
jgi:hypothetical protein